MRCKHITWETRSTVRTLRHGFIHAQKYQKSQWLDQRQTFKTIKNCFINSQIKQRFLWFNTKIKILAFFSPKKISTFQSDYAKKCIFFGQSIKCEAFFMIIHFYFAGHALSWKSPFKYLIYLAFRFLFGVVILWIFIKIDNWKKKISNIYKKILLINSENLRWNF